MAAKVVTQSLRKSINKFYWNYKVSKDFLEVRNIADVASIIIESSLTRKESRACHFREDFPNTNNKEYLGWTIIKKDKKPYIFKQEKITI